VVNDYASNWWCAHCGKFSGMQGHMVQVQGIIKDEEICPNTRDERNGSVWGFRCGEHACIPDPLIQIRRDCIIPTRAS
jgi:hypothetical protein